MFTKKEWVTSVIIPITISIIAVGGSYLTSKYQLESSKIASDAQIKAARISKVNTIEYDYKETSNWEVSQAKEYFPLAKGNYWIYSGEYQGYSMKNKKYYTKKIELKLEIKEEIKKHDISLFIMNNYFDNILPQLHDYYDLSERAELEDKEEKIEIDNLQCGLLLVANKLFYISNIDLPKVKKALLENELSIDSLRSQKPILSFRTLIFEFPLFKGQRFGDFDTITRKDLRNFWYVNDKRNIEVLNNTTFENVPIYQLVYNSLPDHSEIKFRPYIGVLDYSSVHHGTTDDLFLRLKEYEIKESAHK